MSYNLNFSDIDSIDDVHQITFDEHEDLVDFIDAIGYQRKDKVVYVLGKDGMDDLFISDNYLRIQSFLEKMSLFQTVGDYFLFEFKTYDEAYKYALSYLETNELCC